LGEPERLIRVKPERIVNGSFALVEIPDPKLGPRKMGAAGKAGRQLQEHPSLLRLG
jgi:hypothetical protein